MAVDANTGDISWRVPLGTSDELEAKGIHNTGAFGPRRIHRHRRRAGVHRGTIDKRIRAFESRSGKLLWEAALDAEGHTNPMTTWAPMEGSTW